MQIIKLNLALVSYCSIIALILLLWNEDRLTCDIVTYKSIETILAITSLITGKEYYKINLKD